jgi:hypothetical protein
VTLRDGRRLTWSVRMERSTVGHFALEGQAFDGWCDGWPVTDEELGGLLRDDVGSFPDAARPRPGR